MTSARNTGDLHKVLNNASPVKLRSLIITVKYIILTLAALLIFSVSVFALYKPVRILLPEIFGISCESNVCVDDSSQRGYALSLLDAAKQRLEAQHDLSIGGPKIIFCSAAKCQDTFGLGKKAGFTLGAHGIVIAPRGWKEYYVAHELIHYWQAENFGSLVLLTGEPWLIEGMAYALSNDPRTELHEPFESYRNRFNRWRRLNAGIPFKKSIEQALK